MSYLQKKKSKREYTREEKIKLSLYNYLRLSADEIDEFLHQNPFVLNIEPTEFMITLRELCNKYLLSSYNVEHLVCYYPEIIFNKSKFAEKKDFYKETFGFSEVAFGQLLKRNPQLLMMGNKQIINFVNSLNEECGVSINFARNLLTKCPQVNVCVGKEYFDELSEKLKFLKLYHISAVDVENLPSICFNSFNNLDKKIKMAILLGVEKSDFLDHKYKMSKEDIFARIMAQENNVINIQDLYCSDRVLQEKTGYSAEQLMRLYPYDKKAELNINKLFAMKHPELSEASNSFLSGCGFYLAEVSNNSEIEEQM